MPRSPRVLDRVRVLLCAPLLLALAAAPLAAQPPAPREVTLRNGARALIVPDPRASAVSVGVWVESGVRFEKPGAIGLSHLAEHLSARGIDPAGETEARRRIEALGGTATSFTTADFTCFIDALPPAGLATALELEARRFGARPTAAMLDQDRATVRAENAARARINPLEHPLQSLYAAVFASHPYRFPVSGIDADLGRLSLKDCLDFLAARYTPDHVLVTVVGACDGDEALALVRRHFESLPARGGARPAAAVREPEPTAERRRAVAGDLPVPVVMIGWRAPAGATDDVALDLLSALLSAGPAARLNRRLVVDDQTCLFARTGRDRQHDATLLWAAAALRPGADSAAVEKNLITEIERLASEPVPGEELDRARKQLEVSLLGGRQSAVDRAQVIGAAAMITGDWHDADRQLVRLRALTPSDLEQAAQRTLTAARRTVVWMRAAGGGGGR